METKIQIIGDENLIIFSNLNKQFSTINKIIITKDILFSSFDTSKLEEFILTIKKFKNIQRYKEAINSTASIFEDKLKTELYHEIQESLNKISQSYMDVKLKDYNFMNSVSNTKFNVVLRCDSFSISSFYVEKGTILANIKSLIKKYVNFEGNFYRLPKIDSFQIEIYESQEAYKHIYLKKEGTSLLLSSTFGFSQNNPINYEIGCEHYLSKGSDFQFFQNKQTTATLREHNKIDQKEINPQEKILTNEDLVLINEKTKNIDDALIECIITNKGKLKIINLSLLENSLEHYTQNGFILNKSRNNYDRICIMGLRDNLDEETINPKYLLLKNEGDIKAFINSLSIVEKIDGIILNQNFYIPILDKIGHNKNIDIIYINNPIQKSLDEKINWETLEFENSNKSTSQDNPFTNILGERNKEKDELLEKLKNIDLSTPEQTTTNEHATEQRVIEKTTTSIIGSSNSSFNKNKQQTSSISTTKPGEKVSALGMLAQAALGNGGSVIGSQNKEDEEALKKKLIDEEKQKAIREEQNQHQNQNNREEPQQNIQEEKQRTFDNYFSQPKEKEPIQQNYNQAHNQTTTNNYNKEEKYQSSNPFDQIPESKEEKYKSSYNQEQQYNTNQNNYQQQSSPSIPTNTFDPISNNSQSTINNNTYQPKYNNTNTAQINTQKTDISKYEETLATELLGDPNLNVDALYVDMNTISQVGDGKIYFLTINKDDMTNPNLNYVLPIGLNSPDIKNCSLLINNINDYFLINKEQKEVEYFVNINEINDLIKKNFIKNIMEKVDSISLICMKKDLELISNKINKIKSIYIKDINSNEELNQVKKQLLQFEKQFLMNKY